MAGRMTVLALCVGGCAPVYSRSAAADGTVATRTAPGGGAGAPSETAAILGRMIWPLAMDGVEIMSSRYGPRTRPGDGATRFHRGLDLRAEPGTPVHAVADARVARSGRGGAYGNHVVLDHGEGLESLYAHHSRNLVREGGQVRRGQVIGLVGRTGNATGDHLHFELRWRGGTVDPWTVLPALDGDRGRRDGRDVGR